MRKREKEKEREIIQLHRLCSRSQTIYVCKEQKGKKKQGKKRRNVRKEGLMSITEKETGDPNKRKRDREEEEKRRKRKEETMSNERVRVIRVSTTWIYIVFFRY